MPFDQPSRRDCEIVVLGCGIAGLAAADALTRAGWQVHVIDRSGSAGGLHRACHIGDYTFDLGSMFYEEDARLFELAPGLRELCPAVMRVQRRIAPDGRIRRYPLDPREVLDGSPLRLARIAGGMAWSRLTVRRDGTLATICRNRLGSALFEDSGLAGYIARFHHALPGEIDECFFRQRMAFVERSTRLGALSRTTWRALRGLPSGPAPARRPLRVRPRDGFEPVFERIVRRLAGDGVEFHFGEELMALRRRGKAFEVHTGSGLLRADAVISTVPVETLHRAMYLTGSGLPTLGMTTLFLSAGWLSPDLGNVLYNFDRRGLWKRATIYSRIYPAPATGREFLAVETTMPPGRRLDPATILADLGDHLQQRGLARDLALEGHEQVSDCYPFYAPGHESTFRSVLDRIAGDGVVLAGRLGRFEYLPTSSGVIGRVAEELGAAGLRPALAQAATA